MDFSFTQEQEQFREEIRQFLQAELEEGRIKIHSNNFVKFDPDFSKKCGEVGYIGISWPKEYGGQGRTYVDRTILMEEFLKIQAPIGCHFIGDRQMGPALIIFGTDYQKAEFLPRILKGEANFCGLFSEPDAGSDLVSVRTTAIEDGDSFIVNGQKTWTSGADLADYGWCLVRTDPDASKKHQGLSEVIIDMSSPGITIRPIINILGERQLNEVFLENVRVPKTYLVGQVNRGFYQIMHQIEYERAGIERLMWNYPLFEHLTQYVKEMKCDGKPLSEDPLVLDEIAQLEIEFQAGRLLCYHLAWLLDQRRGVNVESAICKTYCTQFKQRLTEVATRIMGPYGQLMPGSRYAPADGEAPETYLRARTFTLAGGTVETTKNIISRRGLNLPDLR